MYRKFNVLVAKWRVRISRLFNMLLLGRLVGSVSRDSIESVEKRLLPDDCVRKHVVDMIRVYPPLVIQNVYPKDFPKYFRGEMAYQKRDIFILKDVVVSPYTGMVWFESGIFEQSVGSLRRIMDWGNVLHEPLLPIDVLQSVRPVVTCPPTGYYHWLLEALPNLIHVLGKIPDINIVIPEKSPGYLLDALRILLDPQQYRDRVIYARKPQKVRCLAMPEVYANSGFAHPEDIRKLRSAIRSVVITGNHDLVQEDYGFETKIYVSRRHSRARRMPGEAALEEYFCKKGFKVLYCEEMSFSDQVRAFYKARIIAGLHGAGLSNMVWSTGACQIVEIFPNEFFNDCYAWLASTLGFSYRFVRCESRAGFGQTEIEKMLTELQIT